MTVGELIEKLQQFPKEMDAVDYMYDVITNVKEVTWVDGNYPFRHQDKQVIMLE